jgi:cation-transporting ATPase 13A2
MIFALCLFWYWQLRISFFYSEVDNLEEATHIKVEGRLKIDGKLKNVQVVKLYSSELDVEIKRTFCYRFIQFAFNSYTARFEAVTFNIHDTHAGILGMYSNGLNEERVEIAQKKYGPCQMIVPRKSIPRLLLNQVLNPFYIFQIACMILWFWDGYGNYAWVVMALTVMTVSEVVYTQVKRINRVRKLAVYECQIQTKRSGGLKELNSNELVPGDIIIVPDNCIMPCDMVLLSGQCVVNESMLTGESMPVVKNSLISFSREVYDSRDMNVAKKFTLFSGTRVIQARQIHD